MLGSWVRAPGGSQKSGYPTRVTALTFIPHSDRHTQPPTRRIATNLPHTARPATRRRHSKHATKTPAAQITQQLDGTIPPYRPRQTMHPHNSPTRHIACDEKPKATAHIAGNRLDSAAQQGAGLPKQGQREKPQTNRIYTSFRHKKNTTLPRRCRPYAYALPSRPCNLLKERQQKRASRKRCSYQLRRVEDGSRTHDTRNHNPVL